MSEFMNYPKLPEVVRARQVEDRPERINVGPQGQEQEIEVPVGDWIIDAGNGYYPMRDADFREMCSMKPVQRPSLAQRMRDNPPQLPEPTSAPPM